MWMPRHRRDERVFSERPEALRDALEILDRVAPEMGAKGVRGDRKIVKISIVGVGMRSHAGIASRMFKTLADEGINIRMISTSEIKVSVMIDEDETKLAVRVLHTAYGLDAVDGAA